MYYLVDMFEGIVLAKADKVEDLPAHADVDLEELSSVEDLDLVILKDTKYIPKVVVELRIDESF